MALVPYSPVPDLVLPFENMSPDSEQEFFSDGLTEEMISELGRMNPKRLGVIARSSATAQAANPTSISRATEQM